MSTICDGLRHAITTASNDDTSEPQTGKRLRHVARIDYMEQAINEIERLRRVIARAGVSLDQGMSRESVSEQLREALAEEGND